MSVLSLLGLMIFAVVYGFVMYISHKEHTGKTPDTKRIRKSFKYQTPTAEPVYAPVKRKYIDQETQEEIVFLVDINNVSEETLVSLPGMTDEMVEKVVKVQDEGGFTSVREFINVMGIKPLHAMQLYKVLTCTPVKQIKHGPGRLLDV